MNESFLGRPLNRCLRRPSLNPSSQGSSGPSRVLFRPETRSSNHRSRRRVRNPPSRSSAGSAAKHFRRIRSSSCTLATPSSTGWPSPAKATPGRREGISPFTTMTVRQVFLLAPASVFSKMVRQGSCQFLCSTTMQVLDEFEWHYKASVGCSRQCCQ